MIDLMDVLSACADLDESLNQCKDIDQRKKIIQNHLTLMDGKLKFNLPDFPERSDWMNTSAPLSLRSNLQGKIVILDFFTYCCINCIHVLPDLEALEHQFSIKDGLVVVGVHSAKFDNEKISANILSAILRYNISHPVVNDENASMWVELQIQCWPTFVVVGPNGQFLQVYVGEGHRKNVLEFAEVTLDFFQEKGLLKDHLLPLSLEKDKLPESPLCFPGKISVSKDGKTVIVADTGHNRIIVLGNDGIVKCTVGGPDKGYKDGHYQDSRFNSPQGVVLVNKSTVFVADTDNHVIRKIDLIKEEVETVVGTGVQGNDKEGGNKGIKQEISSPWDLAVGSSPGSETDDILYIAMAGTHQIWVYFLSNASWYKGRSYEAQTCLRFAGSGNEENRNNSYPEKAAFAQPSGLVVSRHPNVNAMFVADSESSSVRHLSLKDGAVKGFVGAERDPMNLFAYGDKDGKGVEAKLQHPLDVTMVTDDYGPLLIVDSYNHKIKSVDIKTKECQTMVGDDADYPMQLKLNEPGGLFMDQKNMILYVADTNNHVIRIIDWNNKKSSQFPIIFPEIDDRVSEQDKGHSAVFKPNFMMLTPRTEGKQETLSFKLILSLPDCYHLTDEAPSSWEAVITGKRIQESLATVKRKGSIHSETEQTLFDVSLPTQPPDPLSLKLKCKIFFCDTTNVCRMTQKVLESEFIVEEVVTKENSSLTLKLEVD